MSTLVEIEAAIAKLPAGDVRVLLLHLQGRDSEARDRQIEEDAATWKLDPLYARLTSGAPEGSKVALHEVLDDPQFS